jgi:heme exporter protein D
MSEFFAMGGYAFYVWVSYGLATVILVANVVLPRRRHRELLRRLTALVRGRDAI